MLSEDRPNELARLEAELRSVLRELLIKDPNAVYKLFQAIHELSDERAAARADIYAA